MVIVDAAGVRRAPAGLGGGGSVFSGHRCLAEVDGSAGSDVCTWRIVSDITRIGDGNVTMKQWCGGYADKGRGVRYIPHLSQCRARTQSGHCGKAGA
eukprot:SAG25_NODE_22_length_22323_cov_52.926874_14_plen_97_part_00